MSRKPLPTNIKRLRGTLRSDRAPAPNPLATAPALTADPVPSELTGDSEAMAQWRRLVPVLVAARRVSSVDRALLVAVCLSYSRLIDASTRSRRSGLTIKRGSGGLGIHPHVATAQRESAILQRWLIELGLSPRSRADVPLDVPLDGDAFSEFDTPLRRPN